MSQFSNLTYFVKSTLTIASWTGATFNISDILEFSTPTPLELPTATSITLKNSTQLERMQITATWWVATIVTRWLENWDTVVEDSDLRKPWGDWDTGAVTQLAFDNLDKENATPDRITIPTVADPTARDVLYPSPTGWEFVEVTSLWSATQKFNAVTVQWESFDIWTPTPNWSEIVAWIFQQSTDVAYNAWTDLWSTWAENTPKNSQIKANFDVLLFWDWSDWDVTISSNTTLTRDMYYNNLIIDNTFTLNPGGYRIFVKLTLTNNWTIARNWANWWVWWDWVAWVSVTWWIWWTAWVWWTAITTWTIYGGQTTNWSTWWAWWAWWTWATNWSNGANTWANTWASLSQCLNDSTSTVVWVSNSTATWGNWGANDWPATTWGTWSAWASSGSAWTSTLAKTRISNAVQAIQLLETWSTINQLKTLADNWAWGWGWGGWGWGWDGWFNWGWGGWGGWSWWNWSNWGLIAIYASVITNAGSITSTAGNWGSWWDGWNWWAWWANISGGWGWTWWAGWTWANGWVVVLTYRTITLWTVTATAWSAWTWWALWSWGTWATWNWNNGTNWTAWVAWTAWVVWKIIQFVI